MVIFQQNWDENSNFYWQCYPDKRDSWIAFHSWRPVDIEVKNIVSCNLSILKRFRGITNSCQRPVGSPPEYMWTWKPNYHIVVCLTCPNSCMYCHHEPNKESLITLAWSLMYGGHMRSNSQSWRVAQWFPTNEVTRAFPRILYTSPIKFIFSGCWDKYVTFIRV